MSEYQEPSKPLTEQEVAMAIDLQSGEGSQGVEALQDFYAAREALFLSVETRMQGKHESSEEADYYIEELLVKSSEAFATVVCEESDPEQRVTYASEALRSSLIYLEEFADKSEAPVGFELTGAEGFSDAFEEVFADEDDDQNFEVLKYNFYSIHEAYLSKLLEYSKAGEVEVKRQKLQHKKDEIMALTREVARTALGTVAAIAAVRMWDKFTSK